MKTPQWIIRNFGSRKKTSTLNDEQKIALADRIYILLLVQLTVAGKDGSIEDRGGNINRKAIGYLFGFLGSAVRAQGYDDSDPHTFIPIAFHVLRRLFPGRETAYMEFFVEHQKEDLVVLGDTVGGQQFVDFMKNKQNPMGLARFIIEGDPRKCPDQRSGEA
jgi:hypothetical protein